LRARESVCTSRCEQDVRRAFHDRARSEDGVFYGAHGRYCACAQGLAIHDRRVELVLAIAIENGAPTCIE
jgi:hypothetical protein